MMDRLQEWAATQDYRVGAGKARPVLEKVQKRWSAWGQTASDQGLYGRLWRNWTHLRESVAKDWSVVVVAKQAIAERMLIPLPQGEVPLMIAPASRHLPRWVEQVKNELSRWCAPHEVMRLRAPFKGVAAQLGMFQYGRNHILYDPQWGSFLQLACYLVQTDITSFEGVELAVLANQCEGCHRCVKHCPTGALSQDHRLLEYSRCLAYGRQEVEIERGCSLGCLSCQESCPMNNDRLVCQNLDCPLSQGEVVELLDDGKEISPSVHQKIEELGLAHHIEELRITLRAASQRMTS